VKGVEVSRRDVDLTRKVTTSALKDRMMELVSRTFNEMYQRRWKYYEEGRGKSTRVNA
jgi:hypothetical protein